MQPKRLSEIPLLGVTRCDKCGQITSATDTKGNVLTLEPFKFEREPETGWKRILWGIKPTRHEFVFWLNGFGMACVSFGVLGFAVMIIERVFRQ